jgi:ABC-2 type transport system permease protein
MSDAVSIARRDFTNARRSKLLWGMVSIYVAFTALLFWAGTTGSQPNVSDALFGTMFLTALLLPLVVVAASYLAVAGERESNTITFLLGLPTTRRSVVAGKFLSRTAMMVLALGAAFLVGGVMAVALYPEPEFVLFGKFAALTTLLVAAYVGVTVGISAMSANRTQAIAGGVGFYFVTDVFWATGIANAGIRYVFETLLGLSLSEDLYSLIFNLSPVGSYLNTEHLMFDASQYPQLPGTAGEPFYLQPWFSVLILLAWVLVPLAIGYWRFRNAEIG